MIKKPFEQRAEEFQRLRQPAFEIITLTLDTARTRFRYAFAGDIVHVLSATDDNVNVTLQFDPNPQSPSITLQRFRKVTTYFTNIYITNTAQAAKTMTLLVAVSDYFDIDEFFNAAAGGAASNVTIVGHTVALPAGTNNIGDVGVLSLPALPAGANAIGTVGVTSLPAIALAANSGVDIGDVDVLSLPAVDITDDATRVLGKLGANSGVDIGDVDVTSFLHGKTVKRAVINASSSGDNTVVAAIASNKIKVLSVLLVANADVTVRFESGAGGTALTGQMALKAGGGFVLPAPTDPTGHWFETAVNTLLNLELSGAVQVSGCLTYHDEP